MEIDITARAVILRPKAEVAAYSANPDNTPKWQTHIKEIDWETPRPLSVGTQFSFSTRLAGVEMGYTYEIAEFVPGERVVMRTAKDDASRMTMETTYTWESLGPTATHMVLRNRGTVPGRLEIVMAPIMNFMMRRGIQSDLKRLKKLLERQM
jgi:uncharacterized membrane protein